MLCHHITLIVHPTLLTFLVDCSSIISECDSPACIISIQFINVNHSLLKLISQPSKLALFLQKNMSPVVTASDKFVSVSHSSHLNALALKFQKILTMRILVKINIYWQIRNS